ncbi:hypothetical protein J4407_00905 [Candidatus Pacearchaeota archaeon]|nr:hypothetical protein [Candidatus Pacearchaeota archaeon]
MAIEENLKEVAEVLPIELVSKIELLIGAVGGLVVIYLVFLIIRFFMLRKQNKMIKQMRNDIVFIKRKLAGRR